MCILQGTFCDTGIPHNFYGGNICSVCNEMCLETNRRYEKSITVENQKLFCACGKKLSIKHTNMKDIKRGITSGRKCVLSSDFTTKWEIMFTLDIISMLGLTRRAYASKDMCYTMFITTEYVIHICSTLGLVF